MFLMRPFQFTRASLSTTISRRSKYNYSSPLHLSCNLLISSNLRLFSHSTFKSAEPDFLFGDLIKEELQKQDSTSVDKLPNTRGEYREQICRTPMLKTSTKRLNLIAHLIKGLDVEKAMLQLMFLKRNHCQDVLWSLQEGCKIARDIQKVDPKNLYVAWAYVCRGSYTKKVDIKGRGRTGRIRSPEAHMVIMLRDVEAKNLVAKKAAERKQVKMNNLHVNERVINPRIKL